MGSKNSKKLNEIDPLEHIEFFKKQTSILSTGLTSESSDLIINEVLSSSESSESINSTDTPNLSDAEDSNDFTKHITKTKLKTVRFNEKVMVICTKFNSRFYSDSNNDKISPFKLAKFYFIDLKDDKYSKNSKIRFLENHREIIRESPEIRDSIQEFNLLRSWSMFKEDTFFVEKI
jgi:hypothetical protein